jgi:hypothetical protein
MKLRNRPCPDSTLLNKRGKAGLHRCDEIGVPVRIPWPDAMAQQQCAGIVIDAIAVIRSGMP